MLTLSRIWFLRTIGLCLALILYGVLTPIPMHRGVVFVLIALMFVPAERLLRFKGAPEPDPGRPVRYTPRVFWLTAAALFVGWLFYMAGGYLARFPQDAKWVQLGASGVAFTLYVFLASGRWRSESKAPRTEAQSNQES